jgi:hypothetical protein
LVEILSTARVTADIYRVRPGEPKHVLTRLPKNKRSKIKGLGHTSLCPYLTSLTHNCHTYGKI